MIDDNKIQYFAGGRMWGESDKTGEFLAENKWVNGWRDDAAELAAKQSYAILNRIKIGDMFAIKSMAGKNHIKVYAIGKIIGINPQIGEIQISWEKKMPESPLMLARPTGGGVGNWQGTLLQITDKDLIKAIFQAKSETDLKLNLELDYFSSIPVEKNYLDSLKLNNYFSIQEEIILQNLKDKKEIYFLGENGDGKTLLLQAILISLVYSSKLKDMHNLASISKFIELVNNPKNKNLEYTAIDEQLTEFKNREVNRKYRNSIMCYGVHRDLTSDHDKKDEFGFMTLCDDNILLAHPLKWLEEIDRKERIGKEKDEQNIPFGFENAKKLLESILSEDNDEQNIKIVYNDDGDLVIREKKTEIEFEQLSTGYKSVLTWVCDLLSRLVENDPECTDSKLFKGIVLVDEIDLFLHPKWAYSIVKKLRTWFPYIQFFFTTHSPIVILGASEDSVIYKVYKEEGITKISEPYYTKDFSNAMANIIITSPLFDLDTARMFSFQDNSNLDTSDSYLSSKIHKKVEEDILKLKSGGQRLFTDKEVDDLIEQAILSAEHGND